MPADASLQPPPASADVPDALFHPAVSAWLHARFGQPTEVQQTRAWPVTARRGAGMR